MKLLYGLSWIYFVDLLTIFRHFKSVLPDCALLSAPFLVFGPHLIHISVLTINCKNPLLRKP